MRVKDFVKMYRGMLCVEVEIYTIVTGFNEEYHVLVRLGGANNAEFKGL